MKVQKHVPTKSICKLRKMKLAYTRAMPAAAGMLLIAAACLCTTAHADKVDLAEWSSNSWSTRVDGVMGN